LPGLIAPALKVAYNRSISRAKPPKLSKKIGEPLIGAGSRRFWRPAKIGNFRYLTKFGDNFRPLNHAALRVSQFCESWKPIMARLLSVQSVNNGLTNFVKFYAKSHFLGYLKIYL
jgi:hypothetical protein